MSEIIQYRVQQALDIAEVSEVLERARTRLAGFVAFAAGDEVSLDLHPRELRDIDGLRLQTLSLSGALPLDEDPLPCFRQILGHEIHRQGQLFATIGYQASGARQTRRDYELVNLGFFEGVLKWSFHSAAAVRQGPAFGKDLMSRLVHVSNLPLSFIDEGEDFRLEHSDGGELFVLDSQGAFGRNPTAFRCAVTTGFDDLLDGTARIIAELGSAKRFEHSWTAAPTPDPAVEPEQASQIYSAVVADPDVFPADRYELRASVCLDDLATLESLRALCGSDDRVLTALGYFRPSDVNHVNLEVVTRADGHHLFVDSRLPIDSGELGNALGVVLDDVAREDLEATGA